MLALLPLLVAPITVENFRDGDTIRYPVALLRGAAPKHLQVFGGRARNVSEHNGQFRVLVELKPGRNDIRLSSGGQAKTLRLNYQPSTSDYLVRVVYLLSEEARGGYDRPSGWVKEDPLQKLDTAAKLMQTFTAESMRDQLGERKTFNLEFDSEGRVVVHTLRYPAPEVELWRKDMGKFWGELYGWLDKQFPFDKNKCLVVMGFTHWDQQQKRTYAHTALGGGGLGLFGNGAMWSWPTRLGEVDRAFGDSMPVPPEVHDDSAHRGVRWALASTTIGAMLHEMGHTFGLPHTSDPRSIMTRGFDRFNRMFTLVEPPENRRPTPLEFKQDEVAHWGPLDSAELFYHRWFHPDRREWLDSNKPSVNVSGSTWTVTAPNGLGMVKWFPSSADKTGRDIHNPLEFTFYTDRQSMASFDVAEIVKRHKAEAGVRVKVMDREGNVIEHDPK
jgi:hypothetical protein